MHSLLMLSIITVGLFICFFSKKEKSQRRIVIWGGLSTFIYGALRASSVGTDISSYVNAYSMVSNMSFVSIFTSKWLIVSRDPVFYSFIKLLTYINDDPQFMLIITAAIVTIAFSLFIYKNSVNPLMSFIMFIGLRYYSFTLSGLRQAIAWSIILFAYNLIKDKKLFQFTLIVVIASLFHNSAILFLIAYPLANFKKTAILSLIMPIGLAINYLSNNSIIRFIVGLPGLKQYESYIYGGEQGATGTTMLLIYISILTFAYLVRRKILKKDEFLTLAYNLSIVGVAITALGFSYANIFRIGYYFVFPIIILLPSAINSSFDKKSRLLINSAVIILLALQYIIIGPGAGTENYQYFWEY